MRANKQQTAGTNYELQILRLPGNVGRRLVLSGVCKGESRRREGSGLSGMETQGF